MAPYISGTGSEIEREKFFTTPEDETGWDRVKMMFNLGKDVGLIDDQITPEMNLIFMSAAMGFATGGVYSVLRNPFMSVEQFREKSHYKTYMSTYDFRRQYTDRRVLHAGKVFWFLAWRMGLFCGTYAAITTTVAVYRNKAAIREHTFAGCLVGGVWRAYYGLRSTLIGSIVGATLGTLAGASLVFSFWVTGLNVEQMRYWNHGYWQAKLRRLTEEKLGKKTE